jgi:hypothetical protein
VSASRVSFSCPSVDHRTAPRHHVGAGRPSMRPQAAGEGGMLRKQKWGLSHCADGGRCQCTFTCIEIRIGPVTSTLWAKATTRGPLTWSS